jgi:hypothetical protein
MPKVTLLMEPYQDYTVAHAGGTTQFFGEKPRRCSVSVALRCKGMKKPDGSPLFKVEDMPTIVETKAKTEKQNVDGKPLQQRFLK